MVSTLGNVFAVGAAAAAGASVITFVRSRWHASALRKKGPFPSEGSEKTGRAERSAWDDADTHPAAPGTGF